MAVFWSLLTFQVILHTEYETFRKVCLSLFFLFWRKWRNFCPWIQWTPGNIIGLLREQLFLFLSTIVILSCPDFWPEILGGSLGQRTGRWTSVVQCFVKVHSIPLLVMLHILESIQVDFWLHFPIKPELLKNRWSFPKASFWIQSDVHSAANWIPSPL